MYEGRMRRSLIARTQASRPSVFDGKVKQSQNGEYCMQNGLMSLSVYGYIHSL